MKISTHTVNLVNNLLRFLNDYRFPRQENDHSTSVYLYALSGAMAVAVVSREWYKDDSSHRSHDAHGATLSLLQGPEEWNIALLEAQRVLITKEAR